MKIPGDPSEEVVVIPSNIRLAQLDRVCDGRMLVTTFGVQKFYISENDAVSDGRIENGSINWGIFSHCSRRSRFLARRIPYFENGVR